MRKVKVQDLEEAQAGSPRAAARIPSVLWSIKEIAAYYGFTTTTIHRWNKAGILPPPEKDFGNRRWDRDAVIRAIRDIEPRRE